MNTKVYRCATGLDEMHLHVYNDGSGFRIDLIGVHTQERCDVLLGRNDARAIIKQLQEYLNETSESTPA